MITAIVLLVAFQGWWLWQTYKDDLREVRFRTNILFRETIWQLQTGKLKMDSGIQVRMNASRQMEAIFSMMRSQQHSRNTDSVTITRKNDPHNPAHREAIIDQLARPGNARQLMFEMLTGIDSLQDSLTISEIDDRYRQQLQKEKFNISYTIKRVKTKPPKEDGSPNWERNEVAIGFANPVTYRLDIGDTTSYLLKKFAPANPVFPFSGGTYYFLIPDINKKPASAATAHGFEK